MDDPVQDATLAGIGANGPPTFIPVDHDPWASSMTHWPETPNPVPGIVKRGTDFLTSGDYQPHHLPGTKPEDYLRELARNPDILAKNIEQASNFAGMAAVGGKAAIFDLFKQGKTAAEIANTVGTSRQYVSKLLRDANLTNNPQGATSDTWRGGTVGVPGYPLAKKGSIWSEPRHNETAVTLFNQGHQFDEIADHLSELTGSTVTKDQVAGRLKRINDENKAIDQLQEQFGPRHDRRTDPAQAAYIRYRLQRGISGGAIARELNLTPASVSNRKRLLRDEADPEAAMDRDLAKSARTIPVDHDPFSTDPPTKLNEPPPGIVAYHASPHDFDKFDFSKIGTGEGAATYGHGGYFSENPKVSGVGGEYFQKFDRKLQIEQGLTPEANAKYGAQIEEIKRAYQEALDAGRPGYDNPKANQLYQDWITLGDKARSEFPRAHSYTVNINARPEHFLDWDRPISAQHPLVQDALKKLGFEGDATDLGEFAGQKITAVPRTGAHVTKELAIRSNDEAASRALRDAGIPGIKYLDQGSRRAIELQKIIDQSISPDRVRLAKDELAKLNQTHNYVVFDDRLIDILKKYGIAALPASGAYHFKTTSVDHDPFERQ